MLARSIRVPNMHRRVSGQASWPLRRGIAFAVIGASPGGFGTILSQNHWLPVLKTLGVRLWTGNRLMVSRAGSVFDANGELVDARVREQLAGFVQDFAAFAASARN